MTGQGKDVGDAAHTIFHPDTYTNGVPYREINKVRNAHAVVWMDEPAVDHWPAGPGFWAVMRHGEARQVFEDPVTFSSALGGFQLRDPPSREDLAHVRRMMVAMDGPEHNELRKDFIRLFSRRGIAAISERANQYAWRLADRLTERGECDFAADIAAELPIMIMADLLGMPQSDRWLIFDWTNRVIGYQDDEWSVSHVVDQSGATDMAWRSLAHRPRPDSAGRVPSPWSRAGLADLRCYAHELAAVKRRSPAADIMSILTARLDRSGGDQRAIDEFENQFWLFAMAGNSTVRNSLPGALYTLLTHPGAWAELRRDRSLLPTAIEEILRFWTPVMHMRRTAAVDTELAGVAIAAGQKVVPWLASANRDERVFPQPDLFDIRRHPNDHLSFGHGAHFCIGAQLARAELTALLSALLDLPGTIRPAGEPIRLRSNFHNLFKHLPVRYERDGAADCA
jgi:cytochrome P450